MVASPDIPTLALDTATPHLTLALRWPGGERTVSREVGRAHAELLPGEVRALFDSAGLPFHAAQLVIGTGPGSYTGVRVGASYALGLAAVWGAPVRGVSTLEALVRGDGVQGVSQDARKGHVYGAVYRAQHGVVVEVLHPPARLPLGAFEALCAGHPHHRDLAPDPRALLRGGVDHGEVDWSLRYL